MIINVKNFKKQPLWIKKLLMHQEGLIVGALAGALCAFFLVRAGYDLSAIAEGGRAIIDNVFSRNAPVTRIAVTKLYLVLTSLGGAFGYSLDKLSYAIQNRKRKK